MSIIESRLEKMGLSLPQTHAYPNPNRTACVQVGNLLDLFFELWGPEFGKHARAAVGVAELPRRAVLEIMGEFEVSDRR